MTSKNEMWEKFREELEKDLTTLSGVESDHQETYILMLEMLKNCKIKQKEEYYNGTEKTLSQGEKQKKD